MVTPTAIDLSTGASTTDAFAVDSFLMTVQASWTNLDGDFDIIPLQTNDAASWNPIYDYKGEAIVWPVRHQVKSGVSAGSQTFQIPDGLHAVTCKLKVAPSGGKFSASTGTVTLVVKNTATEA
jgi:hypothetical protein